MLKELLKQAKAKIEKEMEVKRFIDDSDLTDRFLDKLAYDLTMNNEKIDQDELLQTIKNEIMINYNNVGSVNEQGDYIGCYYKDKKDLIKWANIWQENSIFEAYEEFKRLFDTDVTIEEFAEAYEVDLEDYR